MIMNLEGRRKLSNIENAIVRLLVKFMTWNRKKIGRSVASGVQKTETCQTIFLGRREQSCVFNSHIIQH